MRKWLSCITLLLSLFGALAWTAPWVYDALRRPQVKGKLVGYIHGLLGVSISDFSGVDRQAMGMMYIPRVALCSLYKNYNVKEIEVYVKYPNDPKEYKGQILGTSKIECTNLFPGGRKEKGVWNFPPSEHALLINVLERDRPNLVYIPFHYCPNVNRINSTGYETAHPDLRNRCSKGPVKSEFSRKESR